MKMPKPHSEKWWDWKRNRLPGETYAAFAVRMEGNPPPPEDPPEEEEEEVIEDG